MEHYLPAEHIQLVHSGQDFFNVLENIINSAVQTLHIQTYIFETDQTGLRIINALKVAAARGVQVTVMADAFGSHPFSKTHVNAMREAGIRFRLYAPLFSGEAIFFMRRLHHKIVVADKIIALTGGINIANKYNFLNNAQPWLDYAVLVRGQLCNYLHLVCEQYYNRQGFSPSKKWLLNQLPVKQNDLLARYRQNDRLKGKSEVHLSYTDAILNAQKSITIVASYFLPDRFFRTLLKNAAQRGVKVRLILAGSSDTVSVRLAEKYLYGFYLRHHIEIYEWKNSIMHAKAMVVDDDWATIGSYNINYLSHYLSIELNADIIDRAFVSGFKQHLDDICKHDCNLINSQEALAKQSWTDRMKTVLAYRFHKLLKNALLAGRRYKKRRK